MSSIKIYTAEHNDPWFNLATEDWLFKTTQERQHVLFLWRNKPCIVIGRFQNPWGECNLEAMERDGVVLARRQSGGGAVYHDLGNTNFTFISPADDYDVNRNFAIIVQAIKKFGINAVQSGRNDVLVDERKVSGSAFRKGSKRAFHHGTLLIDAKMEKIGTYLTPDKDKLKSKGIRSVASRVANLTEFNPSINHEKLCDALIEAFSITYDDKIEVEDLTIDRLSRESSLYKTYLAYKDWDWRFGSTPQFDHQITHRFPWGALTLDLDVKRGVIDDLNIFSDSLSVELVEFLKTTLRQTPYSAQAIVALLEKGPAELLPMLKDLIRLVKEEVK
ncbi:MAG: lipoate--protein ligase [Sphaerochaetaceae bacterium]